MNNEKSFWGNIGDYFKNLWNLNVTAGDVETVKSDIGSQKKVSVVLATWVRDLMGRVDRIEAVQEAELKFDEAMDQLVGKQIVDASIGMQAEDKPAKAKRGRPKGKKNKTTKSK